MWYWVSIDADVRCEHKLGRVDITASEDFVFVNGRRIVTNGEPAGRSIGGCPNLGPTVKPCTVTLAVRKGESSFVRIGGRPVVRADLRGFTDGTPQGAVSYRVESPGQTLVSEAP